MKKSLNLHLNLPTIKINKIFAQINNSCNKFKFVHVA